MRDRSKNKPPTDETAIGSLKSSVTTAPERSGEAARTPIPLFTDKFSKQGRKPGSFGKARKTTAGGQVAHKFFGDLIHEEIKKMLPAEENDPNDYKVALQNVKARRFLTMLQKEEEEKGEKGARNDNTHKTKAIKPHSPIPTLSYLRGLKSVSQAEAADYLRRTPRTIRNYIRKKKLSVTPTKRVACDDKLARLLRKTHGDAILP